MTTNLQPITAVTYTAPSQNVPDKAHEAALLGMGCGRMWDTPSYYTTGFRPEPEPEPAGPTKYDLERIAKAQARRERRQARKNPVTNETL